jgi:hypothetical protein
MVDGDRCDLDESELAQRVSEHARPLDPRGLADLTKGDLEQLATRAEQLRARAPFAPRLPFAKTAREQKLRHYLASFGIEVPPRVEGERERSDASIADALEKLARDKTRPSLIHVWAPVPAKGTPIARALQRLKARRADVRWTLPAFEESVGVGAALDLAREPLTVAEAVNIAVRARAVVSRERGERALRRLGVRPLQTKRRAIMRVEVPVEPKTVPDVAPPASTR